MNRTLPGEPPLEPLVEPPLESTVQGTEIRVLWGAAIAVAGLGAWVIFDADPGVNWLVWVAAATAGLIAFARARGVDRAPVLVTGATAVVIAGAAAVTATPLMSVLICGSVILFLAMQMLLTARPTWTRLTPRFAVTAPIVAFVRAIGHAVGRAVEATNQVRSPVAGARLRGLAITLPVLVVFALLLSFADPVFAGWRDTIESQLSNWSFLPRTIFFVGLLGIVLGAYGYTARGVTAALPPDRPLPLWLGGTERLMLLGGVAALFWLFLAVQVSYLFGTSPETTGTGLTFSEYARRGFAELTVVASAATVIIILCELFGQADGRRRAIRSATFAVIVALFFLLASAYNRILLYEEAYGFTADRLYGRMYMIAVALGLLALCMEVAGDVDLRRLFRRATAVVTILFIGLCYWNHEGWIARRNIERFAASGQLDVAYLAEGLSPAAVPTIAERLPVIPEPTRSELRNAVRSRYEGRSRLFDRHWYEWNLGRERARASLVTDFGVTFGERTSALAPERLRPEAGRRKL